MANTNYNQQGTSNDFELDEQSSNNQKANSQILNSGVRTQKANESSQTDNEVNKKQTPAEDIEVQITDKTSPIVLLFGAKSAGKTMTLVRLSRYLECYGAAVEVDNYFCTTAWEYKKNSTNFSIMKGTNRKLDGTDHNDFLFVKVVDKHTGSTVCQILEASGEHYFPSPNMVPKGKTRCNAPFPRYMNDVFRTPNKKVWVFILDPTQTDAADRSDFVKRIDFVKGYFDWNKDRAIILYNKIDETQFAGANYSSVRMAAAETNCNDTAYKGVFNLFKGGFIESDRYTFIPFMTGDFDINGGYTPSDDSFPKALWNSIKKSSGIKNL